ncbi:MAG: hypothetical protein J6J04_04890 [Oscillospiraceae bacterium]|nr:hypothetical protein [Oscillospiraceae bacterium]
MDTLLGKTWGDAASAYSTAQQSNAQKLDEFYRDTARFNTEAFSDYYRNSPGETMAATSGITGSDQTGASIYGYRNDTSWKEPQSYWSDHQKSQYDRLSRDNPGLAESYAATINDAYHQQQLKQNQRKVEAEVNSNNGLAVLHNIGARIGSQFKGLDGINSALEYAGRGRITTNPELTPGTYAQTVDDATYNRVRNQHGEAAADVYDQFTKAFDGIASYVTTGPTGHAIKSGFETGTDALNEAQKNGASDLEAVAHAFTTGVSGATLDIGLNKFFSDTEKFENIPTLKKISESAAINISKAVVDGLSQEIILQDNSTYNSIIKEQMKKGFSKEQATRIALWELAKTPVKGTLEDLSITPAQHRFYESAQRKIGSQIK